MFSLNVIIYLYSIKHICNRPLYFVSLNVHDFDSHLTTLTFIQLPIVETAICDQLSKYKI